MGKNGNTSKWVCAHLLVNRSGLLCWLWFLCGSHMSQTSQTTCPSPGQHLLEARDLSLALLNGLAMGGWVSLVGSFSFSMTYVYQSLSSQIHSTTALSLPSFIEKPSASYTFAICLCDSSDTRTEYGFMMLYAGKIQAQKPIDIARCLPNVSNGPWSSHVQSPLSFRTRSSMTAIISARSLRLTPELQRVSAFHAIWLHRAAMALHIIYIIYIYTIEMYTYIYIYTCVIILYV